MSQIKLELDYDSNPARVMINSIRLNTHYRQVSNTMQYSLRVVELKAAQQCEHMHGNGVKFNIWPSDKLN